MRLATVASAMAMSRIDRTAAGTVGSAAPVVGDGIAWLGSAVSLVADPSWDGLVDLGLDTAGLAPGVLPMGTIRRGERLLEAGEALRKAERAVEAGDAARKAERAVEVGEEVRRVERAVDAAQTARGAERAEEVAAASARFGKATSNDYRKTFLNAYPELEGQVVVHHAVEQQVLAKFPGVVTEAEIHSLENLRGVPFSTNSDIHLSKIRTEWNDFYEPFISSGTAPTKTQLLQKATDIDRRYGPAFAPKVGGGR